MKITLNFDSKEFACRDGTAYPTEWSESRLRPLCEALEEIRGFFGKPITINSGFRTVNYNKQVGGVTKSQHVQGRAADIRIKGVKSSAIAAAVRQLMKDGKITKGGVGEYKTFVHVDIRGYNARWKGH